MPRIIETVLLDGPAGKLEAMLEAPEDAPPGELAVVCHPHPLHGGTMHNKVVYRLARALRRNGSAVLRFNFRGVARSEGHYDRGIGEIEDARAALAWLRMRYPELPYTLAGFSFGSRVALSLGCEGDGASRLIAAGLPTKLGGTALSLACRTPKFIVQSTHDQYGPREELEKLFQELADPKTLVWIQARDHFFAGALDTFEDAVFRLGPAKAIRTV